MSFAIPFNDGEKRYILMNHGHVTNGGIAKALNERFQEHNKGTRSADGITTFMRDYRDNTILVSMRKLEKCGDFKITGREIAIILDAALGEELMKRQAAREAAQQPPTTKKTSKPVK